MKGRQVPVHDIKGGIHPDADPQRIKNNSWVQLENTEYDRQGRLIKTPDFSTLGGTIVGDVRDLRETEIGFLIAADQLQYTTALSSTGSLFTAKVRSKFGAAPNRSMYYVDDNHILRRWSPDDGIGLDYKAGIPVPLVLPVAKQSTSADNVWRAGVQDISNDDSSMALSLDIPNGGINQTYRPSRHSISGLITDPEKAYDGDVNSGATGDNSGSGYVPLSLTIYGFEIPIYSFTSMNLCIKYILGSDSYIHGHSRYSLNGGISWTTLRSSSFDGTDIIALDPSQDLSLIRVAIAGSDLAFTLYDVRVEASAGTLVSDSPSLEITIKGIVPTVIGTEKFKALNIPIKTNNLTIPRDIVVTIKEYYGDTDTLVFEESQTVSVSNSATSIQTADYTNEFSLGNDGSRKIKIGLAYADASVSESLVFFRAIPWFIQNTGKVFMTNETSGETTYTDREPLMAFRLVSPLTDGQYDYAISLRGQGEFEGNYALTNFLVQASGKTHYFHLEDFPLTLAEGPEFGLNSSVIVNRSLVGGGTIYRLKEITSDFMDSYIGYTDTFTGTWDMSTPLVLPPNRIVDSFPLGTATVALTDADTPADLPFFSDTLVNFRSRLFGLVEIEDASGRLTTFLRYSEVDVFDYWPPLNEVAIRDNLIGLCALREDMLLAFSATKTYRITPSGTSFDWVKIADVGLGSVRLVGATNESIVFANNFGVYIFDGSAVTILPASNDVLSLIQIAVTNNGTLNVSPSLQKVFLSLHQGATNTVLIIDTFVRAITTLISSGNLTSVSDIGGVSYFGFTDALKTRGTTYALTSVLQSKRFASNDLNRIRLYYMGVRHLIETSGGICIDADGNLWTDDGTSKWTDEGANKWGSELKSSNLLSFVFTFSTGKKVTKVIDLMGVSEGAIKQTFFDIYGEGEWFDFEITHTGPGKFTLLDYVIGAVPINLVFDEGVAGA